MGYKKINVSQLIEMLSNYQQQHGDNPVRFYSIGKPAEMEFDVYENALDIIVIEGE